MSEALDAIVDIKEALEEFGSDITFKKITQGTYDTATGETSNTESNYNLKAFINKVATKLLRSAFNSSSKIEKSPSYYDLTILFYTDLEVTKKDKVVFDNIQYDIVFISSKILQNTTLLYEILIRK